MKPTPEAEKLRKLGLTAERERRGKVEQQNGGLRSLEHARQAMVLALPNDGGCEAD
jgi:hypothetical protein